MSTFGTGGGGAMRKDQLADALTILSWLVNRGDTSFTVEDFAGLWPDASRREVYRKLKVIRDMGWCRSLTRPKQRYRRGREAMPYHATLPLALALARAAA